MNSGSCMSFVNSTAYSIQYTAYSMQYTAYSIQLSYGDIWMNFTAVSLSLVTIHSASLWRDSLVRIVCV